MKLLFLSRGAVPYTCSTLFYMDTRAPGLVRSQDLLFSIIFVRKILRLRNLPPPPPIIIKNKNTHQSTLLGSQDIGACSSSIDGVGVGGEFFKSQGAKMCIT